MPLHALTLPSLSRWQTRAAGERSGQASSLKRSACSSMTAWAGAQHKQIAVKRHVAAKYHELKGASENKRSVGQSEATVATSAAPAPAEVGSELVQQTVATSGTSLDGLVSLRQLREERWAPWSEDEKARVKSGSCPRGTILQPERNSRRSTTRSP